MEKRSSIVSKHNGSDNERGKGMNGKDSVAGSPAPMLKTIQIKFNSHFTSVGLCETPTGV